MEENKKNLKMPIIMLAVVLVVLLVVAIVFITFNNKPKNIFVGAIDNVFGVSEIDNQEIKTINASIGLGININSKDSSAMQVGKYLNKVKFNLNTQFDIEQEKELIKIGVDYDNENVLNAKISYKNQEDNMYAEVKELFDKTFEVEVDEEMKQELKIVFEEVKSLIKGDNQNSKKASKIFVDSITNRLKDEYFSQENVEIEFDGKIVDAKKSVLTLTPEQIQEVLKGIVNDLKNNEDFMNCFENDDKEEMKNTLTEIEQMANEITSDIENGGKNATIRFNIYTRGINKEFLKFELVVVNNAEEFIIGIEKTDVENYKFLVNQRIDNEIEELLNCTLNIKYVVNEPIESIDTTNSVNVEELTEAEQEKIMTNLEGMKIYKIVQDIITDFSANMINQYNY